MNTEKYEQLETGLWAYVQGELSPEASRQIESELAGDETLRDRLAQIRLLHGLLPDACREAQCAASVNTRIEAIYDADDAQAASENALTRPSATRGDKPAGAHSIPFLRLITRPWPVALAAAALVLISTAVLWPHTAVTWTDAEIGLLTYRGDRLRAERDTQVIRTSAEDFSGQLEQAVARRLRERALYHGKRGKDTITLTLALHEQVDGAFVADIVAQTPSGDSVEVWSLRNRRLDDMANEIDGLADQIADKVASFLETNNG